MFAAVVLLGLLAPGIVSQETYDFSEIQDCVDRGVLSAAQAARQTQTGSSCLPVVSASEPMDCLCRVGDFYSRIDSYRDSWCQGYVINPDAIMWTVCSGGYNTIEGTSLTTPSYSAAQLPYKKSTDPNPSDFSFDGSASGTDDSVADAEADTKAEPKPERDTGPNVAWIAGGITAGVALGIIVALVGWRIQRQRDALAEQEARFFYIDNDPALQPFMEHVSSSFQAASSDSLSAAPLVAPATIMPVVPGGDAVSPPPTKVGELAAQGTETDPLLVRSETPATESPRSSEFAPQPARSATPSASTASVPVVASTATKTPAVMDFSAPPSLAPQAALVPSFLPVVEEDGGRAISMYGVSIYNTLPPTYNPEWREAMESTSDFHAHSDAEDGNGTVTHAS